MPAFPANPTSGQTYTSGTRTWTFNGTAWEFAGTGTGHKNTHATGGSDPITPGMIGAATTSHKSTHATGGSDALTAADIGAIGPSSPTFTGTVTAPILLNNVLRQPQYNAGNSGNLIFLDTANGSYQSVTLTGTGTISGQSGSFSSVVFPNSSGSTPGILVVTLVSPNSTARANISASTGVLANPDWIFNLSATSGSTVFGNNLPYTIASPAGSSYSVAIGFPNPGGDWSILIFGPFV